MMFYRDCLRVFSEPSAPAAVVARPCKTEVSQAGKAEAMIRLAAQSEYHGACAAFLGGALMFVAVIFTLRNEVSALEELRVGVACFTRLVRDSFLRCM